MDQEKIERVESARVQLEHSYNAFLKRWRKEPKIWPTVNYPSYSQRRDEESPGFYFEEEWRTQRANANLWEQAFEVAEHVLSLLDHENTIIHDFLIVAAAVAINTVMMYEVYDLDTGESRLEMDRTPIPWMIMGERIGQNIVELGRRGGMQRWNVERERWANAHPNQLRPKDVELGLPRRHG